MKRYFVLCLMFFLLAFAGVASAAVTRGGTADVTAFSIGTESFRLSSNVQLIVEATTSEYGAVAGHLQGDLQYGTTSAENTIISADKGKGSFDDMVTPGSDELGGAFDSTTTTP